MKRYSDERTTTKTARVYYFLVCLFIFLMYAVTALNFGDQSPDTGEADGGQNIGTFASEQGTYIDTQTNNNVYFAIERGNSTNVAANQTLMFNISILSTNTSIKITGINGTIAYCHARRATDSCSGSGGGQTPQGTAASMHILIQNATAGANAFVIVSNLTATATNTKINVTWKVPSNVNYSNFINSSGFVNVRFEFAWSGSSRSAFLNDHANLTVTYNVKPEVQLSGPANNTNVIGTSNITFVCNTTDDDNLRNVTLYHNLNGSFVTNKTSMVAGRINTTNFSIYSINPGNYLWNCLASDGVSETFAPSNFTLSVANDNFPNVTLISPPNGNSSTNRNLSFIANMTDDITLKNASLFINTSGEFTVNQTIEISGTTNTTTFNLTNLATGAYLWNVFVCDSSNQCAFAIENFTATVTEQQGNGNQPSPQSNQQSTGPSSGNNQPLSPADSGFDRATMRAQSTPPATASRPSLTPSQTASTPESSGQPSAPAPAAPPITSATPITGSAVRETLLNKRLGLGILLVLLIFVVLMRKKIKSAITTLKQSRNILEKSSADPFKTGWKIQHDDYGKEQQRKKQQKPGRLTFYNVCERSLEAYKELKQKGFMTLPKKQTETKSERVLYPKDLKALFPESLKTVREKDLKPYKPSAIEIHGKPQKQIPSLEELGIEQHAYVIKRTEKPIEQKSQFTPTRKINKVNKPKKNMIEGLKGVYKIG